jgi:hypothetical protein
LTQQLSKKVHDRSDRFSQASQESDLDCRVFDCGTVFPPELRSLEDLAGDISRLIGAAARGLCVSNGGAASGRLRGERCEQ